MKTKTRPVFIHECNRCHLKYHGFSRTKPVSRCPRCHNTFLLVRVIADPHPETVERAERETRERGQQ